MSKNTPKDTTGSKVGGLAFFLSLFAFSALDAFVFLTLKELPLGPLTKARLGGFAAGSLAGLAVGALFIRGHLSVFLHEFKHYAVSTLVGNRPKGMKIFQQSGHFEYEYTSHTSRFNALIALAPYYVPLATILMLGILLLFVPVHSRYFVAGVGLGFGVDMLLNSRDISHHQTDITLIRGGYFVGLAYILAINLFLAQILIAWVLSDIDGLRFLAEKFWEMLQFIAQQRE